MPDWQEAARWPVLAGQHHTHMRQHHCVPAEHRKNCKATLRLYLAAGDELAEVNAAWEELISA